MLAGHVYQRISGETKIPYTSQRRTPNLYLYIVLFLSCEKDRIFVDNKALLLIKDKFSKWVLDTAKPGLSFCTLKNGIEPVAILQLAGLNILVLSHFDTAQISTAL